MARKLRSGKEVNKMIVNHPPTNKQKFQYSWFCFFKSSYIKQPIFSIIAGNKMYMCNSIYKNRFFISFHGFVFGMSWIKDIYNGEHIMLCIAIQLHVTTTFYMNDTVIILFLYLNLKWLLLAFDTYYSYIPSK